MFADDAEPAVFPRPAPEDPVPSRLSPPRWLTPRRIASMLLLLLALAPVAYIWVRAAEASRNIAYWDEFDTVIAPLLRLKDGISPGAFLNELFGVSNEHRMVTSRLIFAASYWLTGTVNFVVISFLGNASIVALCVLLVAAMDTAVRRVRLGLLLVATLFQLEHYENFFWSGSSIDHFQVVLLVGAAIVGLARGTRAGWLAAGLCAFLATFTLVHGILVWPVGAAMLWRERRLRHLFGWGVLGALATAGFAIGFEINNAHQFAEHSLRGAVAVVHYWLALLGAVPALGHNRVAPWLGVVLLAALGWLGRHRTAQREPVAFPLAWYGVAALALVAIGRAEQSGGVVYSRYFVLGALSWALVAFMLLERFAHPRPLVVLAWCLPVLVGFNLAADQAFAAKADSWIECRDRAAVSFVQYGVDGRGIFSLYPAPARSTRLLNEAESRGVYHMDPVCLPRPFPPAMPSARIVYFVDDLTVNERSAAIGGWAAIPGLRPKRGELHVLLRSGTTTHMFTTVTVQRPDVADANHEPRWQFSGFRFARLRDQLPAGEYQLGFLIEHGGKSEYIMTDHRLVLTGSGRALRAGQP